MHPPARVARGHEAGGFAERRACRYSQETTPERSGSERCILILRYSRQVIGIHAGTIARLTSRHRACPPGHARRPPRPPAWAAEECCSAWLFGRESGERQGAGACIHNSPSPSPGRQLDAPNAWRSLMRARGRVTQDDNPERNGPERCMLTLRYFPKGHLVSRKARANPRL